MRCNLCISYSVIASWYARETPRGRAHTIMDWRWRWKELLNLKLREENDNMNSNWRYIMEWNAAWRWRDPKPRTTNTMRQNNTHKNMMPHTAKTDGIIFAACNHIGQAISRDPRKHIIVLFLWRRLRCCLPYTDAFGLRSAVMYDIQERRTRMNTRLCAEEWVLYHILSM